MWNYNLSFTPPSQAGSHSGHWGLGWYNCALYERHGDGGSSRYRHLADLLLISQQERVDAPTAYQAVHREAELRAPWSAGHVKAVYAVRPSVEAEGCPSALPTSGHRLNAPHRGRSGDRVERCVDLPGGSYVQPQTVQGAS